MQNNSDDKLKEVEKKVENKKREKVPVPIDGVTILCVFGILVPIAIAVLPPTLRILLPEKIETNPEVIPPSTSEPGNDLAGTGILSCTKQETTADLITIFMEQYSFTNGIVTQIESIEEKTIQEGSSITHESVALACDQSSVEVQDIEGLDIYCNSSSENKVIKTEVVTYDNLDYYQLEISKPEIKIEYKPRTNINQVKKEKEQNGYQCNIK